MNAIAHQVAQIMGGRPIRHNPRVAIDPGTRAAIIGALAAGRSQVAVANHFGIGYRTVNTIKMRAKRRGDLS